MAFSCFFLAKKWSGHGSTCRIDQYDLGLNTLKTQAVGGLQVVTTTGVSCVKHKSLNENSIRGKKK